MSYVSLKNLLAQAALAPPDKFEEWQKAWRIAVSGGSQESLLEFIGRDSLVRQKEEGLKRKLVGFEMTGRGIARDHYPVVIDGLIAGQVTSGSPAPYLQKNIGLTYLPFEKSAVGTEFDVDIRGKRVNARVVATPFYKRQK